MALSHTTKSAIFLSKVFRIGLLFALRSAPKDTCASTFASGKAPFNLLNIASSLSVSNRFLLGLSVELVPFFLPFFIASMATNAIIMIAMKSKVVFILRCFFAIMMIAVLPSM